VHLAIGNASETVTVTGDASLINYENPTLEGGISPETLQDFRWWFQARRAPRQRWRSFYPA
jgi:hypothetical protein